MIIDTYSSPKKKLQLLKDFRNDFSKIEIKKIEVIKQTVLPGIISRVLVENDGETAQNSIVYTGMILDKTEAII